MFTAVLSQRQQKTLELLARAVKEGDFYLAGGTALALQVGHRKSVDFDFFSQRPFNTAFLRSSFVGVNVLQEARGTLTIELAGTKTSFFEFPYGLLNPLVPSFLVPLAHVDDIAAMKISAISGRGSKRDFVDLYVIAQKEGLEKHLVSFDRKFSGVKFDRYHLLRSLTYFEDAENEEMPEMIMPLQWGDVKDFFEHEVKKMVK